MPRPLPTTITAVDAILKADLGISQPDRKQFLNILRNGLEKSANEPQAARVARIVRREEAARMLGMSLRAVDRLTQQKVLRKVRLPGRSRCAGFRESDLQALMISEESKT